MADAFEEEHEQTYTLNDYLDVLEEQELEADLVLGGDDGKDCTYNKGYMKRQAIFSCITCTPDGNAGVCTACSLSCHDGHEIIELWTKRNFRCDCGNSKFGASFCKLFANKDIENAQNSYNHNFKGQYCTCGRPYPDPDIEEQVEMIQCCVCEDWFHEEHLSLESSDEVPRDEEGEPLYEDFICCLCSTNFSFLSLYPETICAGVKDAIKGKDIENAPSDSVSSGKLENVSSSSGFPDVDCAAHESNSENVRNENNIAPEKMVEASVELNQCSHVAGTSMTCRLGVDLFSAVPTFDKSKALFLSKSWRERLCRCSKCVDFYAQKGVGFLLDKEDSIAEYEKIATQKRNEKLQQQEQDGGFDMSFLGELGHVEKMEFLHGIADIKDELAAFLKITRLNMPYGDFKGVKYVLLESLCSQTSCDPSKTTITASDVRQVFDNLSKKRRRLD